MKLVKKTPENSLQPSLKAHRPEKEIYEKFVKGLKLYFQNLDDGESEENLKTHLMDLLKFVYGSTHLIEQQERIDFVIRSAGKGSRAAVLFEAKRDANKSEMIREDDFNRKALHELILHFMSERASGNTDIRHVVVCTEFEFYIFDASIFERAFYANTKFRADYENWASGKKTDSTTEFFYKQIASPYVASSDLEIEATYIDLRVTHKALASANPAKRVVQALKILGPHFLLCKALSNDSNSLNKSFYDELLHLIGLEEKKDGSKRIIQRVDKDKRNPGSLLENTIGQLKYKDDFNSTELILQYGTNVEQRAFTVALELCLTWINRILFLKLLEAQIFNFHLKESSYKFLSIDMVSDFDDLADCSPSAPMSPN